MNKFFELFAKNVRSILAILITVGAFLFLFSLLGFKIPEGNAAVLNVAAGVVLGVLGTVANYYYGSSKDKSDVDKSDADVKRADAGIKVEPPQ